MKAISEQTAHALVAPGKGILAAGLTRMGR